MNRLSRCGRLVVPAIFALALLCVGSLHVQAAPAAPTSAVGVIDVDKIHTGFKAYSKMQTNMEAMVETARTRYQAIQAGAGLPKDDFKEYLRLYGSLVNLDKTRVDALAAQAKKNADDYAKLAEKRDKQDEQSDKYDKDAPKLTDEEKAQLEKLEGYMQDSQAIMQVEVGKLQQQLEGEYTRQEKVVEDLVSAGIGRIADTKKLSAVFVKEVTVGQDQQGQDIRMPVLRWGGVDITDDVIKSLNDNFKDNMLDAPKAN